MTSLKPPPHGNIGQTGLTGIPSSPVTALEAYFALWILNGPEKTSFALLYCKSCNKTQTPWSQGLQHVEYISPVTTTSTGFKTEPYAYLMPVKWHR